LIREVKMTKRSRYRSDVPYRVNLEPVEAHSNNGMVPSPDLEALLKKISRLSKDQQKSVEAYVDGLLSERKR
jgi:hypothetical protein